MSTLPSVTLREMPGRDEIHVVMRIARINGGSKDFCMRNFDGEKAAKRVSFTAEHS